MPDTSRTALAAAVLLTVSAAPLRAQFEPPAHPLFDGDAVHTIRLTFDQPGWWSLLVESFEGQADPTYIPVTFDWENVHLENVGVRFKGNSSYNGYPGPKKSFKLKFDEFDDTQSIYGLDKLNLNNGFLNPSFAREKVAYELAAQAGLPVGRASYAALYINGEYWGLYYAIEDVDKEFIESRFGAGEDGNLWEGKHQAGLGYQGPNGSDYEASYSLETNEAGNDWSALVELADGLSNTPPGELAAELHALMDVNGALAMLAFNSVTVNLDSYTGTAHNYFLYHRDSDGRFSFVPWDLNGSFGAFKANMALPELLTLPVTWTGGMGPDARPLAVRSWDVAEYGELYRSHVRRLLRGAFHPDVLLPRIEALRDLVRPYVLADALKMYSDQEFEDALLHDIRLGHELVPGLDPFVRGRHQGLSTQVGAWTGRDALVLNELMASNTATAQDGQGDFDDWFEIVNGGAQAVGLLGLTASDDPGAPGAYAFPDVTLQAGERFVVWADGEPEEGAEHASFGLRKGGESLFLFDGPELLDATTWGGLDDDRAFGRTTDASGRWTSALAPTPGGANAAPIGDGTLRINEFLASNAGGATDEMGEHEDWLELYNPGSEAVDVGGWFLTDDLGVPTRWQLPPATIEAGGHLLVWCDEDLGDGPLHADFKLGAGGEAIGLFGPAAAGTALIDSYVFGPQTTDVSEGRAGDGAAAWTFFAQPTPGAPNEPTWPRPLLYGIGKRTSNGTLPLLAYTGEPSAASGGFALTIERARPGNVGILFYGVDRYRAPFFGADLWVAPPVIRVGASQLDANGSTSYAIPIGAELIGTRRNYQYFFRDPPHPDGTGAGTTGALEVVFRP